MKKVIICGLGAIGMTYAEKLVNSCFCDLRILVDKERLEKLVKNPPLFNGKALSLKYLLPEDDFKADIIIISTKSQGLQSALKNLKNHVKNKTYIISLINGISSEKIISEAFPEAIVLKSYFIGHSAVRIGNSVTQDGVGKIVIEENDYITQFFKENNIDFLIPDDIDYSMWLKFLLNLFSNQVSAVLNMTFGEMKTNNHFLNFAEKIIEEVKSIAKKEGIKNTDNLKDDAIKALSLMCNEGKTSMLQDILAKRKTEVDIFAGEVIRLGKFYNIPTPYNQVLYDLIKIAEEKNEHSIHSC